MSTLPNFLVIGAARSGTTAVYHALAEHPDIFMPEVKEPQFFTSQWHRGLPWYEQLFAGHGRQTAVGEASVSYTYPSDVDFLGRIEDVLPQAPRLIYIIRDPIARTYSHYLYYRHYRLDEQHEFAEALARNPVYLEASNYPQWIERYRSRFGSDNLRVVVYDDLKNRPLETIRSLYDFLGVGDAFAPKSLETKSNASFVNRRPRLLKAYRVLSRSRLRRAIEARIPHTIRPHMRNLVRRMIADNKAPPPIPPAVRKGLAEHFEAQIAETEKLIGQDLSGWLSKPRTA